MKRQYRSSLRLDIDITSVLSSITDTHEDPSYEFILSQSNQLLGLWRVINYSRKPSNKPATELADHEFGLLALMELIDDFQRILLAERRGEFMPCLVDTESNNYSLGFNDE